MGLAMRTRILIIGLALFTVGCLPMEPDSGAATPSALVAPSVAVSLGSPQPTAAPTALLPSPQPAAAATVVVPTLVATPTAGPTASPAPTPILDSIGDLYYPQLGNGGYDALHYTLNL